MKVNAELLRLVCRNIRDSVIPTIVIAIVLAWVMADENNLTNMVWWCVVQIALQLFWGWQMPRLIALNPTLEEFKRVRRGLMFVMALHGLAWGALAWITVGSSSVAVTVLVISILLSLPGSSTLAVAPLFPVHAAFCVVETLTLGTNLWLQPDDSFKVVAVLSVVSVFGFVGHAYQFSKTARNSFALRFENQDLIEKLRQETAHANAEHARADAANKAKSTFLASASHDLRQPIHAQALFLEVLSQTTLTDHQRQVLDHTRLASGSTSDMLNALLDYSRIEAGIIETHLVHFELQPLLSRIENDLGPLADAKGLIYRCAETAAVVYSDASLVEMVLRNLIANAIRYTNRGGVLIACRARGQRIVLEVWDTGVGIPVDRLEDVFKEFYQLDNPERNNTKGLGLGLSIVDGVCRVLGAKVKVSSRPGRGSVFRLALPMEATAKEMADVSVPNVLPGVPQPVDLQAIDMRVFSNECVLIIEDNTLVSSAMQALLRLWGCESWTAGSLREALLVARQHPPTLILSDYRLPNQTTGTQATEAVCNMLGRKIPSVLITGDTDPQRLLQAHASGVPLLHKPVAPSALYGALRAAIESR